LIPVSTLDDVVNPYLSRNIMPLLDPAAIVVAGQLQGQIQEQRLSPQNGFSYNHHIIPKRCLLYGMLFEHGFEQVHIDGKRSFEFYRLGVTHYLDPLCAYRLASLYAEPQMKFNMKQDKMKAYCYLLLSQ
jgi:hypothetical protein